MRTSIVIQTNIWQSQLFEFSLLCKINTYNEQKTTKNQRNHPQINQTGGVIACLSMTYAGGLFGQVTISSNTTWNGSAPSGYEDGITILS